MLAIDVRVLYSASQSQRALLVQSVRANALRFFNSRFVIELMHVTTYGTLMVAEKHFVALLNLARLNRF